ncbi:MAG: efflux transporter outer membrane subunit [Syntrophobacteraceae bacterium]
MNVGRPVACPGTKRTHAWNVWLVIVCLLLVSGCAVGPDFRTPKMPVPEQWLGAPKSPGDGAGEATSQTQDLARWWKSFDDPVLDSLIERAIASNLDLALARSRVRQARAARGIVASGLWPQLDGSASYQRRHAEGFGGAGPERNLFQIGLDAAWEIDIFGGIRRNVEASSADIQAAHEDGRDVLVSLVSEMGTSYAILRGTQEEIAIARRNLAAQRRTADITRKRYEAGFVSKLDVANADAQAATTESVIPPLESTAAGTIYSMSLLLGQEPGVLSEELSTESPVPSTPPTVPVGIPSDLLRRRPDIRRAEAQIHGATARIGVATADLFPKFSLTGSLGFSSTDLAMALNWTQSRSWSFGPSVTWPIFQAGRILSNIEVQNALEEQALLTYQKVVLTALNEVETALVAYAKEHEHYTALDEAVRNNRQAVDLSMQLYVAGRTDFLNVLTAQRSLFVSEEALALSSRTLTTNLIAIYKALGGGWDSTSEEAR